MFKRDPLRLEAPRIHAVERFGCALRAPGAAPGVYYVETYVDLPADREAIVAVQGAFAIFVDDVEVLTRDTLQWGIWPRFGARVRLEAGRHRIVARVAGPETSVRIETSSGTALGVVASDDPAPPYAITPPEVLPIPTCSTPSSSRSASRRRRACPGRSRSVDPEDPISRALAAYLAHVEGQDDVGAVLIHPLVADADRATGTALAMAAGFLEKDPIYPQSDARDRVKDVRATAAERDPELWWPRFWLLLDEADKSGAPEVTPKLAALADHFREVPDILKGLGAIYARIGWRAEHHRTVRLAAERFPDDGDALRELLRLDDEDGDVAGADKVAARIKQLEPESEVDFERAVERRDFPAARRELDRLGALRKDRRDIAARIADLITRAGASQESMAKLEMAVLEKPEDAGRGSRSRTLASPGGTGARSAGRSWTRSTPARRPPRSATRSSWSRASRSSPPTASTAAA